MKELVNVYGFDDERLVFRLLEVTKIEKGYILTPKYYVDGDRGGPMVADRNGRATIVGIGASSQFFKKLLNLASVFQLDGLIIVGILGFLN
ncbi:hypothetical protein B9Z55_002359 [Caenorhabditis nigoni]|uniref:Uncharacterized protein n=1 Tax=Caenorhabditis nigoni TaxID=1611254 RepID=A0A2G5VKC7_9PELO|nr:hypothetical protein B9Z55_002359 [Caenorhabditis nigoni]